MPSSTLELVKTTGKTEHINQVVASMAISFGPFAVGLGKGYISPALASLQQPSQNYVGQNGSTIYDSIRPGGETLTITEQQGSWVASLSLLGALFGGLCSGAIVKQGRRRTLLFVSIPLSLSWVLTIFANSVELIYATAFLAGFFSAIVQVAAQVYISEIAHPSIRASLCSAAKVFSQIGLLAAFVMGAWLDWRQLAIVCAAAPLMLLITGQYVPETPSYLLYTNQEARAEKSLQWLRGPEADISSEMATIHSNIRRMRDQGTSCRNVLVPQLLKPLLITCGLMFFQRFSGVVAFNFYAVTIFRDTFVGNFNPHLAAVVTGIVQLIGSAGSGVLSDLIGRLPLLVFSSVFMSLALGGFGFFSYYKDLNPGELTDLDWIPLLCVVTFVTAFSLGINPISWLLVGEIFPLEYRNIGPSMATGFSYICAFAGVKTFVDMRENIGLSGTFWTYAGLSVIGLIFSLVFVPETKGRTLDEMEPKSSNSLRRSSVNV